LLKRIQEQGKAVQVYYGGAHGGDADFAAEVEILCRELDYRRLFIWIEAGSVEQADFIIAQARRACRAKDGARVTVPAASGDARTESDHPRATKGKKNGSRMRSDFHGLYSS